MPPSPLVVMVEVLVRSDGPCLLEVALRLEVDEGALRDAATPEAEEEEEVSQGRAATAAADRDDVDDVAAGFEDDDDDDDDGG